MIKIFNVPYANLFSDSESYSDDGKFMFSCKNRAWLDSDWLTVGDNSYACFYTNIPRERRILFVMEPPEIRKYEAYPYYLEQFGTIVSPFEFSGYSGNLIISNPRLSWFAGRTLGINSIKAALNYQPPEKVKCLSMVSSLKHKAKYHRIRSAFMFKAQKEFGNLIDCFGRDTNPVNDKLDAIAPYKYHITIENSRHANYWTEKLTDAWLGWALPIYCGDPTILEQIPDKRGIELIDVDDVEGSLRKLHEIVDDDIYYSRLDAIKTCREWAIVTSSRLEITRKIIETSNDKTPRLEHPELFKRMLSSRKNYAYKILYRISATFADRVYVNYCRSRKRIWE